MVEEQRAFMPAKDGPVCRRHGPMKHYSSYTVLMGGGYCQVTALKCDECNATVAVPRPSCNVCGDSMALQRVTRHLGGRPKFFWRCRKDELSQSFELCECGSVGWLHMDNRHEGGDDPHNEAVLGIPCGMHIDMCSDCGHYRFQGSIDAELAHRRECGCGHGLPKNDDAYTWIGYRGANNEVWRAMHGAGFHVSDEPDQEDFEVYIEEGKAALFIQVLDNTYAAMEEERKRRPIEQATRLLKQFDDAFPQARYYMSAAEKNGDTMTCPHPDHDPDRNGFRKAAKTPGFAEDLRPLKRQYSQNETSTRKKITAVLCLFSEEEMKRSNFEPDKVLDSVVTDENGFPRGKLMCPVSKELSELDLGKHRLQEAAITGLARAAMALIGQLNEMNFQDHPKEEALRLKSRQRGLLEQLDELKRSESPGYLQYLNSTSVGHDRQANFHRRHLPTAGGFRFGELHPMEGEDNFHGVVYLDGITFYAVLIKVQNVNGEQQPTNDPEGRYQDLLQFNDGNIQTVKIDSHPGDFVMCIYPATE